MTPSPPAPSPICAAGTDVWDYVPRAGVLLLTRRIFTPLEFAAEKHAARHFEATEAPTAA